MFIRFEINDIALSRWS